MMERLTEREAYWFGEEFWISAKEPDDDEIDDVYMKLKHYEDLEEQGLLLKLPCKVGDYVYSIECDKIEKYVVSSFDICMHGIYAYQEEVFIGEMGFSVFTTKEEAEAKLKELENE
jgi:hypothetical protein